MPQAAATHTDEASPGARVMRKTVVITAPVRTVWQALTDPSRMRLWMFSNEIEVMTP